MQVRVETRAPGARVSKHLYGQFAEHIGRCIYDGLWVGEDSTIPNEAGLRLDVLEALQALELPVLRWPGGCFADTYHWREGVGPKSERPKRHNLWWQQPESNAFGTHEFLHLCELLGCEPYICLNVGSGSPREARDWVEYCNSSADTELVALRNANGRAEPWNVKFWGIGNETWGCGGRMRPEYYADLYRNFAAYVKAAAGPDARLFAVGSFPDFPEWDERFLLQMKGALDLVDFLAVHVYSGAGMPATDFTLEEYYRLMKQVDSMVNHVRRTLDLVSAFSTPSHKLGVVLDEWGTWYREAVVETGMFQQNTLQDALFAAVSFHRFHELSDGLCMTNMAQTVNVLQALVLTSGPQAVKTPTYHVFDLFKPHREGRLLPVSFDSVPDLPTEKAETAGVPAVSVSATLGANGRLCVSLVNLSPERSFECALELSAGPWQVQQARQLAGELHAHNTFEAPETVTPADLSPQSADLEHLDLPPASITMLELTRPADQPTAER